MERWSAVDGYQGYRSLVVLKIMVGEDRSWCVSIASSIVGSVVLITACKYCLRYMALSIYCSHFINSEVVKVTLVALYKISSLICG
jgi:hypothetical protein